MNDGWKDIKGADGWEDIGGGAGGVSPDWGV